MRPNRMPGGGGKFWILELGSLHSSGGKSLSNRSIFNASTFKLFRSNNGVSALNKFPNFPFSKSKIDHYLSPSISYIKKNHLVKRHSFFEVYEKTKILISPLKTMHFVILPIPLLFVIQQHYRHW